MQILCSNKACIIFVYNKWTVIATMNMWNNSDVYFQNSTQEWPIHCLTRWSRSICNSYLVYCLKIDALLLHIQFIWRSSNKNAYLAEILHILTKWPPLLFALLIKCHFCSYLTFACEHLQLLQFDTVNKLYTG